MGSQEYVCANPPTFKWEFLKTLYACLLPCDDLNVVIITTVRSDYI